jgi:hypothetical protein
MWQVISSAAGSNTHKALFTFCIALLESSAQVALMPVLYLQPHCPDPFVGCRRVGLEGLVCLSRAVNRHYALPLKLPRPIKNVPKLGPIHHPKTHSGASVLDMRCGAECHK